VVVVGLLAALLPGLLTPAAAHTSLDRTQPADGARLPTPPRFVVLTFSQSVASTLPARAAVTGPGGAGAVTPLVDGRQVRIPVPDTGPGRYRVAYRVVAPDGHVMSGDLSFTASRSSSGPTPDASAGSPSGAAGAPTPPATSSTPASPTAPADDGTRADAAFPDAPAGGAGTGAVAAGLAALAVAGGAVALALRRRDP
jgi:hypothetical protein